MGIASARRAAGIAAFLIIVAGCSSSPRFTASPPASSSPEPAATPWVDTTQPTEEGSAAVELARDYLGTPYRNGGTTSKGMDCSGLTFTVFRSLGVEIPRTSRDQSRYGAAVERGNLTAGDLIFFGSGANVTHVGIYAGEGEFIHASDRSRSVRYDRLDNKYFKNRYITARRVL